MCGGIYSRKLEPFFQVTPYIAEFWNTISNLPFILIGLIRLYEDVVVTRNFYILMIVCGIASSIHHATTYKWTIIIDLSPILISIIYFFSSGLLQYVTYTSLLLIAISMFVLITDHVYTKIPVPWGHVLWHLLVSFAIDSVLYSVETNMLYLYDEYPAYWM